MLEHRKQPLASRHIFYVRMMRSIGCAGLIIAVSLGVGMVGYHFLEKLPWLDAFVNASMILSGMGPVAQIQTSAGKLFAGCYALFSGLAFITSIGVVFAPIFHRFLHRFHLDPDAGGERRGDL